MKRAQQLLLCALILCCINATKIFPLNLPFIDNKDPYITLINIPSSDVQTANDYIIISGKTNKDVKYLFYSGKEIHINTSHQFTLNAKLEKVGENLIEIKAYLANGELITEKINIKRVMNQLDPQLIITSPKDGLVTHKNTVQISGVVKNVNKLTINNVPIDIGKNNQFSQKFILENKGTVNTFEIIAHSSNDKLIQVIRHVICEINGKDVKAADSEEKITSSTTPQIQLISPKTDYETSKAKVFFKGEVKYTTLLTMNNKRIPFNKKTGKFSHKAKLASLTKENTFLFKAKDENGKTAIVKRMISYKEDANTSEEEAVDSSSQTPTKVTAYDNQPVKAQVNENANDNASTNTQDAAHMPVIKIMTPQNNEVSLKDIVQFKGEVQYADKLQVNNINIPLTQEGAFNVRLKLIKANSNNEFNIKAVSSIGEENQKIAIYYKVVSTPEISINEPKSSSFKTESKTGVIKGKINNAKVLQINNEIVPLDKTGQFTYSYSLSKYDTQFLIVAMSEDNVITTQSIAIRYEPKIILKPDIILTEPSGIMEQPYRTLNKTIILKGKLKNAQVLYINNQQIPKAENNEFNAALVMQKENDINIFELTAKNSDEKTTKSIQIFYKVNEIPILNITTPALTQNVVKNNAITIAGKAEKTQKLSINNEWVAIDNNDNFEYQKTIEKSTIFTIVAESKDGIQIKKSMGFEWIPPIIPELTILSPGNNSVTFKDKVLITGKSNMKKILINGILIPIRDDGMFKARVDLQNKNSANELKIEAKSADGAIEKTLNIYQKVPKTPEIKIKQPMSDQTTIRTAQLLLEGTVTNAKKITINNIDINIDQNGDFKLSLKINRSMQLNIKAISEDNIVVVKTVNITYDPPKPPELVIFEPYDGIKWSNDAILLYGKAKADKVTINGEEVKILENGKFYHRLLLTEQNKNNEFKVEASNKDGVVKKALNIFKILRLTPEIIVQSPLENMITKDGVISFKGQTKNTQKLMIDSQDINIDSNGMFAFEKIIQNSTTFMLTAISSDNITVTKSILVRYQKPVLPKITDLNISDNQIVHDDSVLLTGIANNTNELRINNIDIKLDKSGRFSALIQLTQKDQKNEIELQAKNNDGKISKILVVNHQTSIPEKIDAVSIPKSEEKPLAVKQTETDAVTTLEKSENNPANNPTLNILTPVTNCITSEDKIFIKGYQKNADTVLINEKKVPFNFEGKFSSVEPLLKKNAYNEIIIKAIKNGSVAEVKLRIYQLQKQEEKQTAENETSSIALSQPSAKLKTNAEAQTIATAQDIQPNNQLNDQIISFTSIPSEKFTTSNGSIVLAGKINGEKLLINNTQVPLNSAGDFQVKLVLQKKNADNQFQIKAISNNKESTKTLQIYYQDKIIPEIVITEPKEIKLATSNPNLIIAGNVKNVKTLMMNNQPITIDNAGNFVIKTTLTNSINYLITATSFDGTQVTKQIEVIYQEKEKRALNIQLDEPAENFVTVLPYVWFKGQAKNTDPKDQLFINDQPVILDSKGFFNEKVSLPNFGRYILNIYAESNKTKNESITRTIYRSSYPQKSMEEIEKSENISDKLNTKITIELSNADIKPVLKFLAQKGNLNVVADKSLSGIIDISLKDVPLKNAIDLVLNSQGLSYEIIGNTIVVAESTKLKVPTSLKTTIIKLNNIKAADAATLLEPQLTAPERIEAVERDNMLLINASPKKMNTLINLAHKLDEEKTPQIILEARILETSTAALKELGIAWPGNIGIGADINTSAGKTTVQSDTSISAILNSLEQSGQGKILARPNIKAINNKDASIFIGDKVPYTETNIDATGKLTESVKFVDSGIKLNIKPVINPAEKTITILIEPEVSFIYGWRGNNNNIPWVKTRKVSTTVSLKDGETVIIGGLFNSSDTDSLTGVPLLGNIPLLGNLFRNSKLDKSETQLIITVTPKIISDDTQQPPSADIEKQAY